MLPQQFKYVLDELTRGGNFIGTALLKYPGWCGQRYCGQRYLTRGKFPKAKLERK